MKGTVKWFDVRKGYGFIAGEDGQDYFVHYSGIVQESEFKKLHKNDPVEFEIGQDELGRMVAKNVTVIQ